MGAHRLTVSATPHGLIARLSEGHPHVRIDAYPFGGNVLVRCRGRLNGFVDACRDAGIEPPRSMAPDALDIILDDAGWIRDAIDRLAVHGALPVPPFAFRAGRVSFDLVLLNGADPTAVVRELPAGRVEAKRSLPADRFAADVLGSKLFLPELTQKQASALLTALDGGYYDAPRGATTAELAERTGVARSTYEEHLKRAEGQVVRALAPMVRMRAPVSDADRERVGGDAVEAYASFSRELGLWVEMLLRHERIAAIRLREEPPDEALPDAHPYLARIMQHLATGEDDLTDIPLDLEVTPFEQEVLDTLRRIPPGEVLTYGDVARLMGRPRAARAVGRACACNPVPVVVPCHRVVPKAGGLGKYSGGRGTDTKRALLRKEGAQAADT